MRITPAWAGKSHSAISSDLVFGDHPRVGGEKSFSISSLYCATGSPPRGRGKADLQVCGLPGIGITPAWAGKSSCFAGRNSFLEDHPRVGGEKPAGLSRLPPAEGSPPRGRGKVSGSLSARCADGITPAWAGKSYFDLSLTEYKEDHPRVGGEKTKKIP